MNEVAQVLRDALAVLRNRGLAKGKLWDSAGRVCARGALYKANSLAGYEDVWMRCDKLLSEVAREQWPDRTQILSNAIVSFNNHPATTQDDVERVFEKAIARAEKMV